MTAPAEWPSEQLMRAVERTPLPASVGALLRRAAARHGARPALDFFDDGDVLSYAELDGLVDRVGAALVGLGIAAGSHVGIMVHTCRVYPLTWLALARLGAVTVPINYNYTARELAYMLRDSDAGWLVIHADLLPILEGIEGGPPLAPDRVIVAGERAAGYPHHWESLVAAAPAGPPPAAPPGRDDLMNIQYTSGTTGLPKGAMLTQRFWLTFGRVGAAQFQDRPRRILVAQPFYYVDAQWLMLMTLYLGATAFVARRMRASRFLDWMRTYRIDYCNFPEVVSKQPPAPTDYMEHLVVMSCYSHRRENYRAYERRYGGLARQGFSMTEVGCGLYVPMEADEMIGTGAVGIPVAFRRAMVADEAGKRKPPGQPGELCLAGPGILRGYYNNPEATAAAFHGDWFRTGDVAIEDEAGWFYYLGRSKDMVRRSNENVSAVEVEGVLRGAPGVLEAAVLPVPDDYRGEEVKAYLTLDPGVEADEALLARLFAHCEKNLARFKIPRYIEFCAEFPRTPSLKIKKSALVAAKPDLRQGSYDRVDGIWR